MTHLNRDLVEPNADLDLDAWIGQRQATFRFDLVNGVTGENLGQIHPLRSATLTHDTASTIKRQLTLSLGLADSAAINKVTDRVLPFMVFSNGMEYPLGRYMFVNTTQAIFTSGELVNCALTDEMFLVDQAIEAGLSGNGGGVTSIALEVLKGLPIKVDIEASPYSSVQSWAAGSYRGQILNDLALVGGYFSPWFGNDGFFHMIQAFEPASILQTTDRVGRSHDSSGRFTSTNLTTSTPGAALPKIQTFNFDDTEVVVRGTVIQTDDLLTRPNRFLVISNTAADPTTPAIGIADVASNAPNSFANRGFIITQVTDLQVTDSAQAIIAARNLALRQTILEKITLSTPPDPRHDSYDVIQWQGDLWLELAWSMELTEGGTMTHTMRKSYS